MDPPSCCVLTGKVRYDQKVDADAYLALFQAGHGPHRKTPKRSYYCQLCGGWHLTSKTIWRPHGP